MWIIFTVADPGISDREGGIPPHKHCMMTLRVLYSQILQKHPPPPQKMGGGRSWIRLCLYIGALFLYTLVLIWLNDEDFIHQWAMHLWLDFCGCLWGSLNNRGGAGRHRLTSFGPMFVMSRGGCRNFKTGGGAVGFWVWRLFWCPFTYISYLSVVRVENKIHIVKIECWLPLNYCVLCSQYLQKQPQYFVQTGGGGPGAPVLDPPLMSTYKWYTRTYKRIGFQHEDDFVHLNNICFWSNDGMCSGF